MVILEILAMTLVVHFRVVDVILTNLKQKTGMSSRLWVIAII
jgi:hypothetical protein